MKSVFHACVLASTALILSACQKDEASTTSTESTPPAAVTEAPPPPVTPAVNEPVAAAGAIGIAECDDYLNKYEACVNEKVPEASRELVRQGMNQTRDGWRQAINAGTDKTALAGACKMAMDSAKQAMAAYGCSNF